MAERRLKPLPPPEVFRRHLATSGSVGILLVIISLAFGMAGYAYFENLPWRDAFLNSAMLMGGMGPVDPPKTAGGKLFAGLYALYAGMVYLAVAGVLLVPVIHRVLHRFHWEAKEKEK